MKSMARAILFGGFVAATTAAVGDKLSSAMGETDNQQAASTMPADQQPGDSMVGNGPGTSTEGAAADVAATSTYAELQPGDSMTVTPSSSADIVAATPPPAAGMTPAPRPAETVARRMPPRVAYEMTTAFPSSVDDAGRYLIASRTHADIYYANAAVMTAAFAYPSATDDAGRYLIASRTHADIYLDRTRFAQRSQTGAD